MIRLLSDCEPNAVSVQRTLGRSPFFLVCDHASRRIPERLANLGLTSNNCQRHIAWDIGAAGVSIELSQRLDATLVLQNYSRLVIDSNRPFNSHESIPLKSEDTTIPGNQDLSQVEIEARRREIFLPYHTRISTLLDERVRTRQTTILVSLHSFTPTYRGSTRRWHIGVLYRRDHRFAQFLLDILNRDPKLRIGDNEPYAIKDAHDYTIPIHGELRGILHVAVEIRQDLVEPEADQNRWGKRLAGILESIQSPLLEIVSNQLPD